MSVPRGSGSASDATCRPPKKFSFLHLKGDILPLEKDEESHNLGEWDIRLATIKYDSTAAPDVQRETIFHEMLHVILEHTDIDPKRHENIIRAVSPLLLEMLTRNPKLLKWLIG